MLAVQPRARLYQTFRIRTHRPYALSARMLLPRPPLTVERIVVIPPLVGASASQSLITFRNLVRRGSALMSFEYRGHGASTGLFNLDCTITDTRNVLKWASDYANAQGLPLHGFTTCYGVIALAAQFTKGACPVGMQSFSAVSGLFRLNQILKFSDFVQVFSRYLGRPLDTQAFLQGIERNEFQWNGTAFRSALQEYLANLFPGLDIGHDHFEELKHERVDIPSTLLQLSRATYLDRVSIPTEVPCNFFYGRNDDVLSLVTETGRCEYRNHVLSMIPHAQLHECEIDHVGRGPDHDVVIEQLGDLFEESEANGSAYAMSGRFGGLHR